MFGPLPEHVRLLDAGAGVGSLTAAFVDAAIRRDIRPRSLEVVAYELEPMLCERLTRTLEMTSKLCASHNVVMSHEVIEGEFVEKAVAIAKPDLFTRTEPGFDCAILNPPYRKIRSNSMQRRLLRRVGVETSNLYTAFVALAIHLLRPGGQLVAITPRSFCNGPYFRPFREFLLEQCALTHVHVFDSRTSAFSDDAVLQENVIFRVVKGERRSDVRISSSNGPDDRPMTKRLPVVEVIRPGDPERFIRLSLSEQHERATTVMSGLTTSLADLGGLQVSTGRVVEFRSREHLRPDPEQGSAPLIYPRHFDGGFVAWPLTGSKKPNAIKNIVETQKLLVPRGTYVLTKRFTSKEERRRIVAAIYDPERVTDGPVGFENHLNYFHAGGRGLSHNLARGLWLFLNSTVVDQYFRQFSGHTQVNATDLRSLRYPNLEQIEAIGLTARSSLPDQTEIDESVERVIAPDR